MTAAKRFRAKSQLLLPFDYCIEALRKQVVFSQIPGGVGEAALIKPTDGDLVLMGLSFKFGSVESLQIQGGADKLADAMLNRGGAFGPRVSLLPGGCLRVCEKPRQHRPPADQCAELCALQNL